MIRALVVSAFLTLLFVVETTHAQMRRPRQEIRKHGHAALQVCDLLPANMPRYPERPGRRGGITKRTADQVMAAAFAEYAPVFRDQGLRLVLRNFWQDDEVNAGAYPGQFPWEIQQEKFQNGWDPAELDMRIRRVDLNGGLARHPEMTADAYLMVLCHEIGHHIGGLPIVSSLNFFRASNEGQADYFAASKCMRRVLSRFDNVEYVRRNDVDAFARQRCFAAHQQKPEEAALCMRVAMAGVALARVLGEGLDPVSLRTPDRTVVDVTDSSHPGTQCRLDTYFQGALCRLPYTAEMNFESVLDGACAPGRATGSMGIRPACWFHPKFYERPELVRRFIPRTER